MSSHVTRLGTHASLIRSKSETFRRLLLFFLTLLWKSSPRLLLVSIFCAAASKTLKMASLLGTLKLAYIVFYPPARLVAALQPALDITGLTPTAFIASASCVIIIGIFAAAAIMNLVEVHNRDKTKRQFEFFLTETVFTIKAGGSNRGAEVASKLAALSNLTDTTINALCLSAILVGIWILLLVLSPPIAIAIIFCASLMFAIVLYLGSRSRKRTALLNKVRADFHAALKAASLEGNEPGRQTIEAEIWPDRSLVVARMQTAHDAQSRIARFRARLDSMALISTGILVGVAMLMMIDADVVHVILILLLVRFFLSDGQKLAGQLQKLSDKLDVIDWARATFR